MTEAQSRFLTNAIRRKDFFLQLSILGVIVAIGLGAWYIWRSLEEPSASGGTGWVLVLLVLLNARQNLRQHRYAVLLQELMPTGSKLDRQPA